ncbi:hypothetical protein B0A49_03986 [Cryomyces minteri]|uniref:Uncharacterized protein n=1 Tax=Cryomyces minteri TaxID=331657 RepID=A0A4U0X7Z0_9PEZI|nr:hypothetical protein B0A49_03986 [Cryomyces minteri]
MLPPGLSGKPHEHPSDEDLADGKSTDGHLTGDDLTDDDLADDHAANGHIGQEEYESSPEAPDENGHPTAQQPVHLDEEYDEHQFVAPIAEFGEAFEEIFPPGTVENEALNAIMDAYDEHGLLTREGWAGLVFDLIAGDPHLVRLWNRAMDPDLRRHPSRVGGPVGRLWRVLFAALELEREQGGGGPLACDPLVDEPLAYEPPAYEPPGSSPPEDGA